MADSPVINPKFGELNSIEHSNEPDCLEPENLNGIDLIQKNNQNLTKPNVIGKLVGPFQGLAFRGKGDQTSVKKTEQSILSNLTFGLIGAADLKKIRIRIPELHISYPELGEDLTQVEPRVAAAYPEFIAQSTDVPEPSPGTIVWCNFLDRENFKQPIYIGPVDTKNVGTPGGSASSVSTDKLAGVAASGDLANYKNSASQVSIPAYAQCSDYLDNTNKTQNTWNSGDAEESVKNATQLILSVANSIPNGGGYRLGPGDTGIPSGVIFKGQTILKPSIYWYCSGFTFKVIIEAATSVGLLENKTPEQIRKFQQQWYGSSAGQGLGQPLFSPALENLGIGTLISADKARPGDFMQIWRTRNGQITSGHSTIFLGWLTDKDCKKIIGVRYRSAQGNESTGGVGNSQERFTDSGGSVSRELTYFSRLAI